MLPDGWKQIRGKIADVNVFSKALDVEKMKAITTGGEAFCGQVGDHLSWEEMEWNYMGEAKTTKVSDGEPCRAEQDIRVFTEHFLFNTDCMQHCEKMHGRAPPVTRGERLIQTHILI